MSCMIIQSLYIHLKYVQYNSSPASLFYQQGRTLIVVKHTKINQIWQLFITVNKVCIKG